MTIFEDEDKVIETQMFLLMIYYDCILDIVKYWGGSLLKIKVITTVFELKKWWQVNDYESCFIYTKKSNKIIIVRWDQCSWSRRMYIPAFV